MGEQSAPKYTSIAEKALALMRPEAERLGNNYIAAEHLFLALLAVGQGGAGGVLQKLGINVLELKQKVEAEARRGYVANGSEAFPWTARVRRILKLAAKEAANCSPSEPMVGTEHILMGFLIEGDSVPARVLLHDFEIDAQIVRQELMHDGGQ